MSNLPTQQKTLPEVIAKNFNSIDNEVLSCILNKPKPFRLFNEKDEIDLGVSIVKIIYMIGVKDLPTEDFRDFLVKTLCKNFPNFTLTEFSKAFVFASTGKLTDVDVKHYQSFDLIYVSSILNAYKKYRSGVFKKYQMIKDRNRREEAPKVISKKEKFYIALELVKNEFEDYTSNPKQYSDSEYRNSQMKHIYVFLLEYKLIREREYEDIDELKSYILSWFRAIKKKDVPIGDYIRKELGG